ncbi:MAG TPA: winged helix-turn-helix domain-containing protein, partial [Pyrinomonadaceae bacterium]|nr:winged helix-turn-helix domain-containing protein [Pyrinomonadaceae bacterium]
FYEFGEFRLDPAKRLLWRAAETVPLMPKAFDVLLALVRRHGRVVTKDELMTSVWLDTVVEENSLNVQVSALRKAFGERPQEHRFIVTVPGVGYEFVAEVREVYDEAKEDALQEKAASRGESQHLELTKEPGGETIETAQEERFYPPLDAPSRARRTSGLRILSAILAAGVLVFLVYALRSRRDVEPVHQEFKTVAVLPFKPLSSESRDETLEMGMADTLITKLSNINQIIVRPISAVRKYADPGQDAVQAGRELQADVVLDGSIQKVGDRLRVSVRVVSVPSGATLWAGQFDESSADILKVQDSISEQTVQALTLRLKSEERERLAKRYTDNPEAYQLYLQGRNLWKASIAYDYERSIGYYRQAIEKDPNFALAYVGMAVSYIKLNGYHVLPPEEAYSKARAALARALELDDTLAEAYNTLAEIEYQYDYDWTGAEREFRRALELNPNVPFIHQSYCWYLMSAGRFDEALAEINRAQDLDPHDLIVSIVKARLFYFMRQYDKSIEQLKQVLEEESYPIAHWSLGAAYEQEGKYDEAFEEYLTDLSLRGFIKPEKTEKLRETFRTYGWQGYVRKQLDGLNEQAKKEYVPPVRIAEAYIRVGKNNEALDWLEKTVDTHDTGAVSLKIEPLWDGLRSDPRFMKLLQRTNQMP